MVTPERSWKNDFQHTNSLFFCKYMCANLVELLVVADSQLKMARIDASLLVVKTSIAGQLEDFTSQVFFISQNLSSF
jgi:hypothetical protein